MKFGHIPIEKLNEIDFRLPPEPEMNETVLPGTPAPNFRFNLGLSSWGRPRWVGKLYPPRTKDKDFLPYYAQHFNAIELNSTHYNIYKQSAISTWREKANNPDFIFCPKMYKGVTHFGSLKGKEDLVTAFQESVKGFGNQLGAQFIQLSDKFSLKRNDELIQFLNQLPADHSQFLELREPEWFITPSIFEKLQEYKVGAVITDAAGRRDAVHMHLTIPKVFVRFVANDMHPTDAQRIREWAERIRSWKDKGLQEVNFFLHSLDDNEILRVAQLAIEVFNEVCEAKLKPLVISSEPPTLF